MTALFAGLDGGDREPEVVVRDEQGGYSKPHKFRQSAQGLADLDAWAVRTYGDRSKVLFFVETKHGFLVAFLLETGYTVYALPSAALQRWRKPSGAKTDAIDARLLAKYGASEWREMHPLQPDSDLVRELRSCVRPFRATMRQMAFCTLNHDPESRGYYRRKMHAHALRCLANRWVRIIFRMWKDGTTYDPAIFRQAQAEHRPRPKAA